VIGILLSGSVSDGVLGMKAIKMAGGLTYAQDGTARSAIYPQPLSLKAQQTWRFRRKLLPMSL
jgi:chemotaxis response regulator CheB